MVFGFWSWAFGNEVIDFQTQGQRPKAQDSSAPLV